MSGDQIALVVVLPLAIVVAWLAVRRFKRFDALLREIYITDKKRWKDLGGPTGYFWRPEEKVPFLRSTFARDVLYMKSFSGLRKNWPNKRPDGTSAKAPPSKPSQGAAVPHP